jgi:drug/metabolite transporter (DMT)-like permease
VESDISGGALQSGAQPSALAGISLMLTSMACFAVSDVFAKQALVRHSGAEIAWYRYAGLAIVVFARAFRHGSPPRSRQPHLQLGRGLGLVGSTLFFNVALKVLPLAETTALAFASPLFVTLVSAFALRERVDGARWAIVATGFAGVLIVMRPSSPAFQAAALLPLLGACLWAIGVGFSRKSISHDSVATTTAYSCVVGLAVLSVIAIPGFVVPTLVELVSLTMMSATWSIAQWLNLRAFHRAEASLLAPFAYSQLFWATLLGYAVFAHVPDGWSLLASASSSDRVSWPRFARGTPSSVVPHGARHGLDAR